MTLPVSGQVTVTELTANRLQNTDIAVRHVITIKNVTIFFYITRTAYSEIKMQINFNRPERDGGTLVT
jgi:hypothetical protein